MNRRPATHGDRAPRWLRWVTRISLVLGMIALAITVHVVGIATIGGHLQTIGPWFAVLLALEGASTFCDAAAVHALCAGPNAPTYRKVVVAQFAGRAVNSVTPGGNLGEALKVSLLARTCAMPRIIAAVLGVGLWSVIISLAIVTLGALVTAVAFDLPTAARIGLVVASGGAIVAVSTLALLVRRGMLVTVARLARRLRLISAPRADRWSAELAQIDARLRGETHDRQRARALGFILVSQVLSRVTVWASILASGYVLGLPQLVAILSAGVLLAWLSSVIPLGVGVAEGGNGVLFALIGAPSSLGVALALAKRVNQIVFAAIGFGVLAADRLTDVQLPAPSAPKLPIESSARG